MSVLDKTYRNHSSSTKQIWCDEDEHVLYERYLEFNEWFDSDDGINKRAEYGIEGLSQPSKALFAGDNSAYNLELTAFRNSLYQEVLSKEFIEELTGEEHWYKRNFKRFEQLMDCLVIGSVVPFIGAGISAQCGFPSWKMHLIEQGKTSGLDSAHVTTLLNEGQYEQVIEEIEKKGFKDAFVQEIKDTFSSNLEPCESCQLITDLFSGPVITTNYDRTIENAYETFRRSKIQIIESSNILENLDYTKTTIIKLHGDIKQPSKCIISKSQYDDAYGLGGLDLLKPIPTLLRYYFETKSLLFLGCSLNRDKTLEVFRAVKEMAGDTALPSHFSLESLPKTNEELLARNNYLAGLGITAIWFPTSSYEYVEQILELANIELRYRGVTDFNS